MVMMGKAGRERMKIFSDDLIKEKRQREKDREKGEPGG